MMITSPFSLILSLLIVHIITIDLPKLHMMLILPPPLHYGDVTNLRRSDPFSSQKEAVAAVKYTPHYVKALP